MRLALYQPDIPQNTGAMMRLAACFRVPLEIIEPCGFPFDEKRLKRTAMDYGDACELIRHVSWDAFLSASRSAGRRIVLLTTSASSTHLALDYTSADTLLLGRESHGVPENVHAAANSTVRIPIAGDLRSLNVVIAAAMVLGEAGRQLGWFNQLILK